MGNLVVIEFPEEHTAFAVRAELAKMQKEYLIKMEDVVVVTKDEKSKVKLHQAVNLTMAGAASGSFWGMLMDIGIEDKFIKEFSANFTPGASALFVLFREASGDKVLERLKAFKGKVLKTSLAMDDEEKLRKVLEA